jgi:hypothetical protein
MHSRKIAKFLIGAIGIGIATGVALAVKSIIEDKIDLIVVTEKDVEPDDLKSNSFDFADSDWIDDVADSDEMSEENIEQPKKKKSKILKPYSPSSENYDDGLDVFD